MQNASLLYFLFVFKILQLLQLLGIDSGLLFTSKNTRMIAQKRTKD